MHKKWILTTFSILGWINLIEITFSFPISDCISGKYSQKANASIVIRSPPKLISYFTSNILRRSVFMGARGETLISGEIIDGNWALFFLIDFGKWTRIDESYLRKKRNKICCRLRFHYRMTDARTSTFSRFHSNQ